MDLFFTSNEFDGMPASSFWTFFHHFGVGSGLRVDCLHDQLLSLGNIKMSPEIVEEAEETGVFQSLQDSEKVFFCFSFFYDGPLLRRGSTNLCRDLALFWDGP